MGIISPSTSCLSKVCWMNFRLCIATSLLAVGSATSCFAQVERVWLTHQSRDPGKIVVSWTTATPSESVVRYGFDTSYENATSQPGQRTLHHVEIAVPEKDAVYHYSVGSPGHETPDAAFKTCPTDEFRIAVVANWHAKADLSALIADDVHLLTTGGDNISSIWQMCGAGKANCTAPYEALIDRYPELFRSTPFMPVLGNHDREIRPRGDRPPADPVYDVDATAFREFFALPEDEWKWMFDIPEFDLKLIALDFNHISDQGTTWQTCHQLDRDSEQFRWYEKAMADTGPRFVLTLYNERNGTMRGQAKGAWNELFRQGSACISGFGHFGERAEVEEFPFFNTSLNGRGAKYPDPKSQALHSVDNYLLITARKGSDTLTVELKGLDGKVLDRREIAARK